MTAKSSRRARSTPVPTVSSRRRAKSRLRRADNLKASCYSSLISDQWDHSKSVAQNYQDLGLCHDVNKQSIHSIAKQYKAKLILKQDDVAEPTPEEHGILHDQLMAVQQQKVVLQPVLPSSMPVMEQGQIAALIRKYGPEDLESMANDIKLNVWQKTAAQLRKRVLLYQKLQNL